MKFPSWNGRTSVPVVQEALDKLKPALMLSVERPGITADGRYFNMHGRDISAFTAKFDLFFNLGTCPTIAFGDGGNEIGMGNVNHLLTELPIAPSITTCDELVIATVSNWGVYGVIAELSELVGQDLFTCFKPRSIVSLSHVQRQPGWRHDGSNPHGRRFSHDRRRPDYPPIERGFVYFPRSPGA
jgi:hypothetical protein